MTLAPLMTVGVRALLVKTNIVRLVSGLALVGMVLTQTNCAPGRKPIVKVRRRMNMTVKELRAKLSTVPEDAQVEMLMCQNDNPVEEACRVDKMVYFQWLEKDGASSVVLYPA